MSSFMTVLKFELGNYFKKKGFLISTILISVVMIVILTIPSVFDMSGVIPGLGNGNSQVTEDTTSSSEESNEEKSEVDKFAILDTKDIIKDKKVLENVIVDSKWIEAKTEDELKKLVKDESVVAGFKIDEYDKYEYYVNNTSMHDSTDMIFKEFMTQMLRNDKLSDLGIDANVVQHVYNTPVESTVKVLGKDGVNNYFYAYILVFVVYMMILIYGQMIAMSVTAEKSNRAMELLVTSTSTNSLIFGKVFAGAIASIVQFGTIIASGVIGYKLNSKAWNGLLDGIFNIPGELLVTFALFGIVGYIFYAFMFGALGALVSKTEDLSSSISPVIMVFILVFFLSMYGLNDGDSMLIKVASFIPFSSPMVMIVRVGTGITALWEVIVSFVILVLSTFGMGVLGAKIYRMGTLRYGNPIKIKDLFKIMKKS